MVISWPDTSIFDISCSKRIIFDPPFAHYVLLASGIYSLFNWSSFFYAEDHLQILVFQQSSKSKSFATRNFFILQTMISYGYHEDEIFQMYNFWATFQVEYLLGLLFHVTPFFSNYTKWSKPHSSRDQNTNNLWKGSYSFFISCTFFVPPFVWSTLSRDTSFFKCSSSFLLRIWIWTLFSVIRAFIYEWAVEK